MPSTGSSCCERVRDAGAGWGLPATRAQARRRTALAPSSARARSSKLLRGWSRGAAVPRQAEGPGSPPRSRALGPAPRSLGPESLWQQHPRASLLLPSRKPDQTLLPFCSLRGGFPSSAGRRAHCHPGTSPAPHRAESQAQSSPRRPRLLSPALRCSCRSLCVSPPAQPATQHVRIQSFEWSGRDLAPSGPRSPLTRRR